MRERPADYAEFLRSPEWRACRQAVLDREEGDCKFCDEKATEVHHVWYGNLLSPGMCVAVCKKCHEECDDERLDDWVAHLLTAPAVDRWVSRHFRNRLPYSNHELGAAWVREQHRRKVEQMQDWDRDDPERRAYWRWYYRMREDFE